MQCTVCHKTLATIHVLDLQDGKLVGEQNLCPACAEEAEYVQSKVKFSPEMLEDLIGGIKPGLPHETRVEEETCPACGLNASQFRARGRLGCPRCYDMFRKSLIPLLERVHDASSHRGRCPAKPAGMTDADDRLAELRRSLTNAIDAENYELAASLRDEIQTLSAGNGDSA